MSKYAPAREDGNKPYVVTQSGWGKTRSRIGWGKTVAEAKYQAFGRQAIGEYITGCRRATPDDMERL